VSAPRLALPRTRRATAVISLLVISAVGCTPDDERSAEPVSDSGATRTIVSAGTPRPAPMRRLGTIGKRATAGEIAAWDIDVNPTGAGLPPGRGTHGEGARLYVAKCAVCHGAKGEGLAIYPALIGTEPKAGFSFADDYHVKRTIGNYWPYATTLYDYIGRAMPLTAPGSLTPTEKYSLVAFLLAENGVIDRGAVMDARSLPAVRMPARQYFVTDDRTGGHTFR